MALPPAGCVRIRPLQAGLDNWLIQVFNRPVDYIATRSRARAAQSSTKPADRPRFVARRRAMQTEQTIDIVQLRSAIQTEYTDVANHPAKGFHFHTGRYLADRLGYPAERVATLPDSAVESFAGVGNPFSWGEPAP